MPERPSSVRGWKKIPNGTVLNVAELVLNKGESSEGKTFGVTLVDIKPATLCGGVAPEPSSAEITFRFYRPSTGERLCQPMITEHGTSSSGNLGCPEAADLPPGIGINAYNAKDGWVWLGLAGTVGDTRW